MLSLEKALAAKKQEPQPKPADKNAIRTFIFRNGEVLRQQGEGPWKKRPSINPIS